MRKFTFLKMTFVAIVLIIKSVSICGQTTVQDFGTATAVQTSSTGSTAILPNPTSGTTWARGGAAVPNAPINILNTSNPLGTIGSYLRATASTSNAVTKFSPWIAYSGGTEFYTSFKVLFGDVNAGSTATTGNWIFFQGAGTMYSDATDFVLAQVFTGLKFTFGTGGALALTYRNATNWVNNGLVTSTFSSGTVYSIEIVGNNKTSGTISYTYNGVAQTVPIQKFDLYINGALVGNDLSEAGLPANTTITSGTFIGISSTSNAANIFVDDVIAYNIVPATIGSATSCTPSTLAFSNTTVNKTMADAAFNQTATSLNGTTSITYASNNTAVANVNETTGEVSLVGAGVATITATQAAGSHSAVNYCAATATYTLNVASILPTITVTEVSVPEMVAVVGNTKTETVNVCGINLAENLTVSVIDDVNNEFDEPSVTSISKLGDHTASGTITITYRPTAAGTHTATLKIESLGATTVTRALSGTATWAPLNPPVAIAATTINSSSFTANWESVSGATEYELNVYTKALISSTDLIISEYIEGSSYNKAIEIYNGTGTTVDLSNYSIKKQSNGVGEYANELVLSGHLANGNVYVIAYAATSNTSNAEILNKTNLPTSSFVLNFNGNDAVALFKGAVQIDEIGIFNQGSPDWGANATFVRKISATSPAVPYNANDWTTHTIDYFNNLGIHTGTATTPIFGSPFTITGSSIKTILNLDAGTTYYYSVVAKNANVTSEVSNEITGATLGTGIGLLNNHLEVSEKNGNIIFFALDNETVEIYNAVGQKLLHQITVNGLNIIPLTTRGVVLIKVGKRFAKVLL